MGNIRTLTYYGGKNPLNSGSGKWVASCLPQETDVTYVEPFCGMCGILVQRPKSFLEIANDINGRIANWLRVIQESPEELAHRVQWTGLVQEHFNYALENMDNPELSKVERAWCFYVVVNFSMMHGDERGTLGFRWQPKQSYHRLKGENIIALSERLINVHVYNMDAIKVIERVADIEKTIIYCDPPYPSTDTSPYLHSDIDQDRLIDVLKQCKGKVAISGYRDEWDKLGWQRQEFSTSRGTYNSKWGELKYTERTEVLWTNYELAQRSLL